MSDYPLSLVEKLSFVRYGGTFEEARAAQILLDELASAGGHGELMEFEIDAPVPQACDMTRFFCSWASSSYPTEMSHNDPKPVVMP